MANETYKAVIGKRQVLRELKNGTLAEVFIAADADMQYITELAAAAKRYGVGYRIGSTRARIAQEHGIDVPTGAIGVLRG